MGNNLTSITKRGNILQFQSKPFSQGTIRYAFKAKIIEGPDKGEKGVIKVFKNPPQRCSLISAEKEMKVYGVANDYAKMYCEELKKIGYDYSIHFPEPDLVKIKKLSFFTWLNSHYFSSEDYVMVQKYLNGDYKKYTNNAGYSNNDQIMETFQHYTFIKSRRYAICCDLQGVLDGAKYLLTDPAVNSLDKRFGNTDMGVDGILQVLGTHKCNSLCKKLLLPNNDKFNPEIKRITNSTTHRRSHTYGI